MINTEIFECSSSSNYKCFNDALESVNHLISTNNIRKDDIIEYKTENWCKEVECEEIWYCRITISFWVYN